MDLVQAPPRLLAYRGKRVAWVYRRRRWPYWHLTLHPVDAIRPVAHRELPVGEERRAQGLWREMEAELAGLIGRRHEVGP